MSAMINNDHAIDSEKSSAASVSRRRLGALVAIGGVVAAALVAGGAGPAQAAVGSGGTITVATPKSSYAVTPASPTAKLGSSFAAALQSNLPSVNGKAPALPAVLGWSSSNRAVATVSTQGVVQTVGAGTATITASYTGGSVTTVVLVVAK